MDREVECRVWCPSCKTVKYTVWRERASSEGVYQHVTDNVNPIMKLCECGTVLESTP